IYTLSLHDALPIYDDGAAPRAARLAGGPRGHAGGHGIDRRLLEAGLLHARGRGGVLAAQCAPPPQRPRAEDRCRGCGLDLPARGAWASAALLRAAQADPGAAQPDAL